MPFEVSHRRQVSDSIAVDIDNDGRMLFEIRNADASAEIALSDPEVDSLILELCSCMSKPRLVRLVSRLQSWIEKGER